MIGLASIGPDAAVSNIAKWLEFFGVDRVPDWLRGASVDRYVIVGAVIAGLLYLMTIWFAPWCWRRLSARSITKPGIGVAARTVETTTELAPYPDTSFENAVRYLTDFSQAELRTVPAGSAAQVRPNVTWVGEQRNHAIEMLRQEAILGTIRVWGRRQIGQAPARQHEDALTEIPTTYWNEAGLSPLLFMGPSLEPHTAPRTPGDTPTLYWDLTFSLAEVIARWPPNQDLIRPPA